MLGGDGTLSLIYDGGCRPAGSLPGCSLPSAFSRRSRTDVRGSAAVEVSALRDSTRMRERSSAMRLDCNTGPFSLCAKARMHCREAGADDSENWLDTVEAFSDTELPVGTDTRGLWAQLRVPDSQTRRRWDLAIYALVIYTLFYFSFSSAFAVSFGFDSSLAVEYSIDIAFALDIALSSRSFFYLYSGDLCTDTAEMQRNYLTGGMLFDVIGIVPAPVELMLLLLSGDPSRRTNQGAFRLVRLLRLMRISKLPRFEKSHYTYLPGLRVAQLFLSFYAVVHVVACVMYLVFATRPDSFAGDPAEVFAEAPPSPVLPLQEEHDDRWLNDDVVTSSTSERYIDALYVSLLIVVGEDSYPRTSWERAFVVGAMIFGACFYATVVGSVAVLVKNTDVQTKIYCEHMDALNSKMEVMGLPKPLRRRVASYYSFVWKRLRKFSTDHGQFQLNVDSFIQELPLLLREEISLFLHKSMVEKVPLFHGCAESFLSDIVVHLRPQVNMPNELIIDVGDVGDRMFFLSSGTIEICAGSGRSLRMLKSGDYMGEFALITGEPRSAMALARTFVLLHVLLKADFERIMRAWPEYETRMAEACEKRLMSAAVLPAASELAVTDYVSSSEREIKPEDVEEDERTQHTLTHESVDGGVQHGGNATRQQNKHEAHCKPAVSQGVASATPARRNDAIVVDTDMMKDVTAIRTILAKRTGVPTSADSSASALSAGHSRNGSGVMGGARYHFRQPNEPESEQQINDGDCRRSQGDRFARGHSARFTELHPPPTSRFPSARPSSSFMSRPSSQGTCTGRTT